MKNGNSTVKKNQTYKYVKDKSIVGSCADEYSLSQQEYYKICAFFVTYSLCKNQSQKSRTFRDYGWEKTSIKGTKLEKQLKKIIDLDESNYVFTDYDNLKEEFAWLALNDGEITDLSFERLVIGKTKANNRYLKLFYRIRDGFAHGKYCLRLTETNEKMVVIQDNDRNNVTGRIVLKLTTLLSLIDAIDIKGLLKYDDE